MANFKKPPTDSISEFLLNGTPYIIKSKFDSRLQVILINLSDQFNGELVISWRLVKKVFSSNDSQKKPGYWFTAKDVFFVMDLFNDLIKVIKDIEAPVYSMFAFSETEKLDPVISGDKEFIKFLEDEGFFSLLPQNSFCGMLSNAGSGELDPKLLESILEKKEDDREYPF